VKPMLDQAGVEYSVMDVEDYPEQAKKYHLKR